MAFHPDWGARIATARKAKNLTQARLAAIIDVGVMQVSRWERGVATPNDENRLALAGALGHTVAELFPYPDTNGGEAAA